MNDTTTVNPKVYVTDLAAYTIGRVRGLWIEITANKDFEAIRAEIEAFLANSPCDVAESWRIDQYDDFSEVDLGEHPCLDDLVEAARLLRLHGELAGKLVAHFCGDIAEAVRYLENRYLGCYESLADYAESSTLAKVTVPDEVAQYVDYEAMGRDWDLGGEIFTIEVVSEVESSEVHIFTNR